LTKLADSFQIKWSPTRLSVEASGGAWYVRTQKVSESYL